MPTAPSRLPGTSPVYDPRVYAGAHDDCPITSPHAHDMKDALVGDSVALRGGGGGGGSGVVGPSGSFGVHYRSTVFTLPGFRHILVLGFAHPAEPWERGWTIEHPPTCPVEYEFEAPHFSPCVNYRCQVGEMVANDGIDYLDAGDREWYALPAGRYEIESWSEPYGDGYGGHDDWDFGLRIVRAVSVTTVVVSV